MKMPKMGGLEALREIRKDPALQHLPVIMLTTSEMEEDVLSSFQSGANSYVVKPPTFEDMRKALCEIKTYWLGTSEVPVAF